MDDSKFTDPLIDLVVSAGGALGNAFPNYGLFTPVKTLNDTLKGNLETITEKNFTPDQLDFLKNLIAFKEYSGENKGSITYKDYVKYVLSKQDGPVSFTPGIFSIFDPYGQIMTTLGQFNYQIDPKTKNIEIKDKYNFNPMYIDNSPNIAETAYGPYGAIREYAGRKIPEGTGRPVKINLTGLEPSIR